MCPRFHVDHVPCRLITTYTGVTTQWLPHTSVDRSKLGKGNNGKKDEESGLFGQSTDTTTLCWRCRSSKGESWYSNSGGGLVHRSPHVEDTNSKRLLLTLDFKLILQRRLYETNKTIFSFFIFYFFIY